MLFRSNDTATTEIYTLSLHDALPIYGREVGRVAGIERGPGQDLWVVSDGAREHLIPAVAEIVVDVDLAARRVVIRPPDGLLDL